MRRSARGSAMALYTAFIALVGIPLLLASVDLTRMMVRKVHLANAVEAACTAYAHLPDLKQFRDEGGTIALSANARQAGIMVFLYNMDGSARLTQMYSRIVTEGLADQQVLEATCSGEADYSPMMLGGRVVYTVRHTATIKAKVGGISNWR